VDVLADGREQGRLADCDDGLRGFGERLAGRSVDYGRLLGRLGGLPYSVGERSLADDTERHASPTSTSFALRIGCPLDGHP